MMSHSSIPSFGQSSSVQSESTTGSGQAKNSNSLVFAAELSENSSTNAVLRGESEEGSGTSTGEFGVIQASSPQNSSWTFGVSSSPQNSSWTFGTSVPGFDSSVTPTFRDFPSAFAGFARSSNGMLGSSSTFGHTSDPSGKQSSPLLFGCKSTCNSSTGGSTSCNISIGVPKAKLPLLSTLTLSAPSSASGSSLPTFGASTPTLKRSSSSCSASFGWSSGAQYESTTAFGQANNSNGNASAPELSDNSSTNAVLKRDSEIGGTPAGVFGATQASASQNSTLKCGALCPPLRTSISASGVASSPKFGNAATSFAFGQTNNPSYNQSTPMSFVSTCTSGLQTWKSATCVTSPGVFETTQSSPLGNSMPAFGTSSTTGSIFGQKPAFGSFASLGTSYQPAFCAASTSFLFGQKQGFGSSASLDTSSQLAFGAATTSSIGATHTALGTTNTLSCGSTPILPFGSNGAASGVSHSPAFSSVKALQTSSAAEFSSSSNPMFGALSRFPLGIPRTSIFGGSSTSLYYCGSTPALGQSTSVPSDFSPFETSPSAFGTWSCPFGVQTSPAFGDTKAGNGQHAGSRPAYMATFDANVCTRPAEKLVCISAMLSYIDKSPEELRWDDYQKESKGYPNPTGHSAENISFGAPIFGFSGFGASSTPVFSSSPNVASVSMDHTATTSSTTPAFPAGSSPHLFSAPNAPAFGSPPLIVRHSTALEAVPAKGCSLNFANTPSLPLLWSISPLLGQANAAFGQTAASGQTPNFVQSIIASTPAPSIGFRQNMFSSTQQLHSPGNPMGFGQALVQPCFSSLSPPADFSSTGNFGQTPGLNDFMTISGVPGQSTSNQHFSLPICAMYFPPCHMVWFT